MILPSSSRHRTSQSREIVDSTDDGKVSLGFRVIFGRSHSPAKLKVTCRMSQNEIVRFALNNRWLEEQGVPDMRAVRIVLHCGPDARV